MALSHQMRYPNTDKNVRKLRERKVYAAIIQFQDAHGYAPSVRELRELTGISSTSGVHAALRKLRSEGVITYQPETARSIVVLS